MNKASENNINKIISLLKDIEIKSAFDHMGYYLVIHNYDLLSASQLSSPQRLFVYTAGLLLNRNNNGDKIFDRKLLKRLKPFLEKAIMDYTIEYFPNVNEIKAELNLSKYEQGKVTLSAFIDYFTTGMICHDIQKLTRIKNWFLNYDDDFQR